MSALLTRLRIAHLLLIALACVPAVVWLLSVQHPLAYVRMSGLPPGQSLYVLAKLAGLLAVVALWMQAMLALARSVPALRSLPASNLRQHRWLGIATALLVLAHVVLFVIASSLRKKTLALDLLWPNLDHGYYFVYVSVGALAFWLMTLTVFAGWRTSRGHRRWRAVHLLWPVLLGLVFLHALAIGTESRLGAMRWVMYGLAISVGIAGVGRLLTSKNLESKTVR